jgi:hypothetical protein
MKKLPSLKSWIRDINHKRNPAWQLTSAIHSQAFGFPDAFVFQQEPLIVVGVQPQLIDFHVVNTGISHFEGGLAMFDNLVH